jgi:hypothetical protein
MPGRLHGPGSGPACAHQALAPLAVVALAVVRYLSMRANTLKRHDNGQPWAHGRKLRKEQQQKQGTGCWGKEGVGWAEQTLRWLSERGAG